MEEAAHGRCGAATEQWPECPGRDSIPRPSRLNAGAVVQWSEVLTDAVLVAALVHRDVVAGDHDGAALERVVVAGDRAVDLALNERAATRRQAARARANVWALYRTNYRNSCVRRSEVSTRIRDETEATWAPRHGELPTTAGSRFLASQRPSHQSRG